MADVVAAVAATPAAGEDDETWLYGDENKEQRDPEKEKDGGKKKEKKPVIEGLEKPEDKEAGELSGEEESQEVVEEDDSDDDDDNVQVTIGDIKQWTASDAPRNLFKSGSGYQKPAAGAPATTQKTATKGIDVEAQGSINGVPTFEFDIDSLQSEDKPWRKPGADITDYFNYGFREDTWQQYCEKQRRLRLENGVPLLGSKTSMHHSHSTSSSSGGQPISRLGDKDSSQTGSSIPTTSSLRKALPPPNRKMGGTIDVIGSTVHDSRRPGQGSSSITVTGGPADFRKFVQSTVPPPGMLPIVPDYSLPPPGMAPPTGVPPPGVPPPPGVNVPPPGFHPGSEPYDPFYGADRSHPPPGFEDRSSFTYDNSQYGSQYGEHQSYPKWKYGHRDRSPESEYGRDSYWRDRERDRDRERERDRDSYRERERDRDRGRERERSRDRDRDRDRSARGRSSERDDSRHRTRRKHRDEDDDHHRSKHRKSKKRRDKEDDDAGTTPDEVEKIE